MCKFKKELKNLYVFKAMNSKPLWERGLFLTWIARFTMCQSHFITGRCF